MVSLPDAFQTSCGRRTTHHCFEDPGRGCLTSSFLNGFRLDQNYSTECALVLAEVSRRHADEFLVMVLDGAGWHRAKRLNVPANMRLISLPPWSPQLNPVEHVWDEIREKWFPYPTLSRPHAVEEQLITALKTLEEDALRVASLTGFDWIRTIPLNAH